MTLTNSDLSPCGRLAAPSIDNTRGREEETTPPTVDGLLCTVGHFNHPAARYCFSCGRLMAYADGVPTRGLRPPLGALRHGETGTVTIDRDIVLGWAPDVDPAVQDGRARPLILADDAGVAFVHARLELHGWQVRLLDCGSPGGTFIAGPAHVDFSRLTPRTPTALAPGTRITIGQRELTYVSHHRT